MKLSVAIITLNEEENIARCLEAVLPIADEIIVVDSHSGDKTCEIALKMGAQVSSEQWMGYSAQKNSAFEKCTGEWILSIDADEVVTPELSASIKSAIENTKLSGFYINRETFYMGSLLKHAWQPDKRLRLVRRDASPLWGGGEVHEVLTIKGATGVLTGKLTHYSYKTFSDHMARTAKYAQMVAKKYYENGRRASSSTLLIRPLVALIKDLILRGSFLDGVPGIMAALSGAAYSYMKFAFLWEYNKNKKGE